MFRQELSCHGTVMNMRRLVFEVQIAKGNNRYLRFTRINITNAVI